MTKLHILLVDDDPDDCLILSDVIEEVFPESELTCFHDGNKMFKYLEELNPEPNKCITPDLIFLDLNMPQITGQDCLKKIRKKDICKNVPVIIYSTASRPDIIDECYRLGANLYIVKPNDTRKLKEIVQSVVQRFVYANRKS